MMGWQSRYTAVLMHHACFYCMKCNKLTAHDVAQDRHQILQNRGDIKCRTCKTEIKGVHNIKVTPGRPLVKRGWKCQ